MNKLETYKSAWQNEKAFTHSSLSDQDIRSYLEQRSVRIDGMFRTGILFDMVLKTILLASVAGLTIIFHLSTGSGLVSLVAGVLLLGGLLFEGKVYLQLPRIFTPSAPVRVALRERIDFFNRRYLKSLLVAAISSPLMILTGGMYYFYFKYGEVRPLDPEDLLVFSLFLFAGYTISAFFQVRNFRFHIRQLEEALAGFDEGNINENLVEMHHRKRKRIYAMTILGVVAGILLLLLLLSQ